jgi:hypothetical protein
MYTKQFWIDAAERVVATYLEVFLGLVIASAFVDSGKLNMGAVTAAAVSALPAALALVKSMIASRIGDKETAAALPTEVDTETNLTR